MMLAHRRNCNHLGLLDDKRSRIRAAFADRKRDWLGAARAAAFIARAVEISIDATVDIAAGEVDGEERARVIGCWFFVVGGEIEFVVPVVAHFAFVPLATAQIKTRSLTESADFCDAASGESFQSSPDRWDRRAD